MTGADAYERSLYPFLYDSPAAAGDNEAGIAEAAGSTRLKFGDIVALRRELCEQYTDALVEAGMGMAERFARGGKLLVFGNGGSATDAADAVADCLDPPAAGWRALPALSFAGDPAVITAIGNDVGMDNVFTRQLIAFAAPEDIALGISTSGTSANVVAALSAARRRGLLTIGLSGNDGGVMGGGEATDYCFIARSEHIPRIQEGHATLWHALLAVAQEALRDE